MLANVCKIDIPVTPNYHLACKNCFHIVHSVSVSCPIPSTASCTLTSISETTYSFTMLYSESDWRVSVCEWFRSSVKMWSLSSSSCLLLPSSWCFTVVAADAACRSFAGTVHSVHCHYNVGTNTYRLDPDSDLFRVGRYRPTLHPWRPCSIVGILIAGG